MRNAEPGTNHRRSALGARIARLRVPLGFVLGVLCVWLARPSRSSMFAGGAIALAGEAVRIWASGHLEKGREVTSSGPYRWTGHPLYVGSSIMGVGLAVAAARFEVTLLVGAYLIVTLLAAIRTEEAFLASAFGDAYARYRAGEASARPFSWARVRANREYRAVIGLAAVMAVVAFEVWWRGRAN